MFESEEIATIKLFDKKGNPYLKGFMESRERPTKAEEIVQQLVLYRLLHTYGYARDGIFVEMDWSN